MTMQNDGQQLHKRLQEALRGVMDPATGQPVAGQLGEARAHGEGVDVEVFEVSPGYPFRAEVESAMQTAARTAALGPLTLRFSLRVPARPARQDLNRLPTVKNVIAVAAGKGGVGKSTVSVNLAMALKQLGAKVGMLDADIYGPSLPKMLGTAEREVGRSPEGDGIVPADVRGVPLMSVEYFVEPGNAVVWRGPMIHKLLTQFLEDVRWGELDYLIVDLPPGTGDAQLSLAQLIPITGALIVTTPQEVALLDVRKAVNMFQKLEVPVLGVCENMSFYRCPACGHHDNIFGAGGGERLAQEFDVPLLASIPIDTKVAFGGEAGEPIVETVPDGPHAQTFRKLAAEVTWRAAKLTMGGPKRSASLRTVS